MSYLAVYDAARSVTFNREPRRVSAWRTTFSIELDPDRRIKMIARARVEKARRATRKRVASALVDDPSKKLQYPGLIAKGYVPLLT